MRRPAKTGLSQGFSAGIGQLAGTVCKLLFFKGLSFLVWGAKFVYFGRGVGYSALH